MKCSLITWWLFGDLGCLPAAAGLLASRQMVPELLSLVTPRAFSGAAVARATLCLPSPVPPAYAAVMGRTPRIVEGGYVFHVLNRGNARRAFLHKPADHDAFLRVL